MDTHIIDDIILRVSNPKAEPAKSPQKTKSDPKKKKQYYVKLPAYFDAIRDRPPSGQKNVTLSFE